MSTFSETIDDLNTSSGGSSSLSPNQSGHRLEEVKRYFTNEGLQFRKVIAQGNHGGAVLFDQWQQVAPAPDAAAAAASSSSSTTTTTTTTGTGSGGGRARGRGRGNSNRNNAPPPPPPPPPPTMQRRQLVIKYALDTKEDATSDNDEDLLNEYRWLRRFRGAEHIIQLVPEYNRLWRRTSSSGRGRDDTRGGAGGGPVLSHPVIVMEYMENGTLEQLIRRFGRINRRIPQRLLWSFTLCLMRAVAALTYPDIFDGQRRREIAREGPLSQITQNSWKPLNILIGDMMAGDEEHSLAPVLKLIDFGRGTEEDPERDPYWGDLVGLSKNMAGVGWVLQDLVDAPNDRDLYVANANYALHQASESSVFDPYRFSTCAHQLVLTNDKIDKALRDIVAMCLVGQRRDLITLREFLTLGREGRRKKAEDFRHLYGDDEEWRCETDEAIQELMQSVVFDADFDPETFSDELGAAMATEFLATLSISTQ